MIIKTTALMRSGHHAVMEGIYHHIPKDKIFINNCDKNNVYHWYKINDGKPLYKEKKLSQKINNKNIILNFEHKSVNSYKSLISNWYNLKEDFNILIIRDPFNWLASCMSKSDVFNNNIPLSIELWVNHAKECLNITNKLPNKVVVLYNKWIIDEEYRKSVINTLGLDFDDTYSIDTFKGSSSFNGSKNYTERWVKYKDNKKYLSLINDEVKELSEKLFDFKPF